MIQQRDCESEAACKKSWREWNATVAEQFTDAFAAAFQQHEVCSVSFYSFSVIEMVVAGRSYR